MVREMISGQQDCWRNAKSHKRQKARTVAVTVKVNDINTTFEKKHTHSHLEDNLRVGHDVVAIDVPHRLVGASKGHVMSHE